MRRISQDVKKKIVIGIVSAFEKKKIIVEIDLNNNKKKKKCYIIIKTDLKMCASYRL